MVVAIENTKHPSNAAGYVTVCTSIGIDRPKQIRSNFLYLMGFDEEENLAIINDLRNYNSLKVSVSLLKEKYQLISRILEIEDKNERMKYFTGKEELDPIEDGN